MAPKKVVRTSVTKSFVTYFDTVVERSHELLDMLKNSDKNSIKVVDVVTQQHKDWESKFARLKGKYRHADAELKHLRSSQEDINRLLNNESINRKTLEYERDSLKRKISMIRDVLRSNDVDGARKCLDNMDTSLQYERQNGREHSAGSLLDQSNVSEQDFEICAEGSRRTSALKARELIGKVLRSSRASKGSTRSQRSRSEPDGAFQDPTLDKADEKRKSTDSSDSYFDIEMNNGLHNSPFFNKNNCTTVKSSDNENTGITLATGDKGPLLRSRTPTINRLNRPHRFVTRSLLRMESCDVCGRRVAFGKPALKCTECRLVIHSLCSNRLMQVCVPTNKVVTPQSSIKRKDNGLSQTPGASPCSSRPMRTPNPTNFLPFSPFHVPPSPTLPARARNLNLDDWCPVDQQPRVPAIVIHCANEISARGLATIGLYRVSGSQKQITDLYEKFLRGKVTPGLGRIEDIHVVCGCLKLFLRNLSEPLVTYELRPFFQTAGEEFATNPEAAMASVINTLSELPASHLDTLALVMLHLKEVARSPACQMDQENLSKIFGPTLIGFSCPEPQVMQTLTELKTQQAVMKLMFSVPEEIYSRILWRDSLEGPTIPFLSPRPYFKPLMHHDAQPNPQRKASSGASAR